MAIGSVNVEGNIANPVVGLHPKSLSLIVQIQSLYCLAVGRYFIGIESLEVRIQIASCDYRNSVILEK